MYQFKMMLALKKITGPFQTEEITGECTCRLALESEQCYPETCGCAPGLSTKRPLPLATYLKRFLSLL